MRAGRRQDQRRIDRADRSTSASRSSVTGKSNRAANASRRSARRTERAGDLDALRRGREGFGVRRHGHAEADDGDAPATREGDRRGRSGGVGDGPVARPLDHSITAKLPCVEFADSRAKRAANDVEFVQRDRRRSTHSRSHPVPLQLVEPKRLYRQIADQLAQLIASGEFPPGARLPAERELAVSLGVSRTSVREAIISLEMSGLVEVRVGTGIFVDARRRRAQPLRRRRGPGPFELLAARKLVEGEIAALAARTRRPRMPRRCARASSGWRRRSTTSRRARPRTATFTFCSRRRPATARSSSSSRGCGTSAPSCGAACSSISTRRSSPSEPFAIMRRSRRPSPRAIPTRRAPRCTGTLHASTREFQRGVDNTAQRGMTQRARASPPRARPAQGERDDA